MTREEELTVEMLERSDKMANVIAKAMNAMPEQEHSYVVAVVTFMRMAAYAALCMGMPVEIFKETAGEIYTSSKRALDAGDFVSPVKH